MTKAVHVTDGKSFIFQLLPDVFDWYYGVLHNKLSTASTTHIDLHWVYFQSGFPSRVYLKENIQYGGTSCHCFQATNRNWLNI